jgi:hypothetical protein
MGKANMGPLPSGNEMIGGRPLLSDPEGRDVTSRLLGPVASCLSLKRLGL